MKEKYPEIGSDTCTATFNEDGTYSMVDTSFNEQYVSVFERQLGQTSRTTTGIWSINYIEPENKTKFFDENVRVTMTGEDEQGKETSSPGIRMAGDGSDVSVTCDEARRNEHGESEPEFSKIAQRKKRRLLMQN